MYPRPRLESLVPVLTTQLTFVAGWPFVSVAVNCNWPLVSIVDVAGAIEKVPFEGFELGLEPPQPAIMSTIGAAKANRERMCRVIITTIQGVAVIVRARRVCQFACTRVERDTKVVRQRTAYRAKPRIDEEVAGQLQRLW